MRVLISGAGIAGPAAAFWLHRGGAEVTVVEKAPARRPGGQTVDVRGVARTVVDRMGLLDTIRANLVDERGLAQVDAENRRRAEMSVELFGGEGIIAELEILRGDLSRILHEATAAGVDYRFGERIDTLDQDATGVDVTFRSGASGASGTSGATGASGARERFDVVIGADGVHSGVRALAFGPEEQYVRYLGAYGGYFSVPDPGDLDHWATMYNAPGGRVALLRPLGGGRAMAGLSFTAKQRLGRLPEDEQRRVLAERMAGAGWKIPQLLEALPAASDFFLDEISQVHVPAWSRGRIGLLGDAGYCGSPLGGMGTSMSLVGAYVLAGELLAAGDPASGFAAYQERMADYVKAGTEIPPGGIGSYAPQGRLAIALRIWSFRLMTRWPLNALMRKIANRADAIVLPDYGERVYR